MATPEEWRAALQAASAVRPAPLCAETFLHRFQTASRPAALSCSDGRAWVTKGRQVGRPIFTDHVVALMAALIGAPVPDAGLIEVPAELIASEPQISHFVAGVGHGSALINDMTDRLTLQYANEPENRPRMAAIAVLYSWAGVWEDHQLLYKKTTPHLAFSVDHGHFFPGATNWTGQTLQTSATAVLDPWFAACNLTATELAPVRTLLRQVTPQQIATCVGTPPDDWGVTLEEKVTVAEYLLRRQGELLAALSTE